MIYLALVFSLLICAFGVLGLVSPAQAVGLARRAATRGGLVFAAGLRVLMGVALYAAAPASRAPDVLHVLGVVVIIAGVVTLFLGVGRVERMLAWWSAKGPALVRGQGAFALVLGALLAWTLVP